MQFVSFCREILGGGTPWFGIVVMVAWIALRRSVKLSVTISDSKPFRKRD
jgi:hypothetical protein